MKFDDKLVDEIVAEHNRVGAPLDDIKSVSLVLRNLGMLETFRISPYHVAFYTLRYIEDDELKARAIVELLYAFPNDNDVKDALMARVPNINVFRKVVQDRPVDLPIDLNKRDERHWSILNTP